jgi:hypothetical protein
MNKRIKKDLELFNISNSDDIDKFLNTYGDVLLKQFLLLALLEVLVIQFVNY